MLAKIAKKEQIRKIQEFFIVKIAEKMYKHSIAIL
jgi:hypothetical protein